MKFTIFKSLIYYSQPTYYLLQWHLTFIISLYIRPNKIPCTYCKKRKKKSVCSCFLNIEIVAENRFWRKFWLLKRIPYNNIYLSAKLRYSDPRILILTQCVPLCCIAKHEQMICFILHRTEREREGEIGPCLAVLFCSSMLLQRFPSHEIRQSKINSRSVAGPMGQMNRRPSVWCSKYYFFFHDFLQNSLQKYFQSICLFKKKIQK